MRSTTSTRETIPPTCPLETLYEQYQHRLYSRAYSILRNREDAEDACQQAWLNIHHALSTSHKSNLNGWLYCIVTNTAYDVQRKRRLIQKHYAFSLTTDTDTERWDIQDRNQPDPYKTLVERETVRHALRLLPPEQMVLLLASRAYSNAELAHVQKRSYQSVSVAVRHAKQHFRQAYEAVSA